MLRAALAAAAMIICAAGLAPAAAGQPAGAYGVPGEARFDPGFLDLVYGLIEEAGLEAGGEPSPGEPEHTVVIFTARGDAGGGEAYKERLARILVEEHGASYASAGTALSFVTAGVPITQIPLLGQYPEAVAIGDGEARLSPADGPGGGPDAEPAPPAPPAEPEPPAGPAFLRGGCAEGLVEALRGPGRTACVRPATAGLLGWPPAAGAQPPAAPAPPGAGPAAPPGPAAAGTAVSASNGLAAAFYPKAAAAAAGGNIFFSPASILAAFSLLYEGAGGETAAQMERVLGIDPDREGRHAGMSALLAAVNEEDPHAELESATALWAAEDLFPLFMYPDVARGVYGADVRGVDFWATEEAAGEINSWASERTRGRIPDIVTVEQLENDPAAVIANALYFKGTWETQFDGADTAPGEFRGGPGGPAEADLMRMTGAFGYGEAGGAQVLRLPYEGGRLSMLVVLPPEGGLEELEASLTGESFSEWAGSLREREVSVVLPRFEAETGYSLKEPLTELGMGLAFIEGAADFLGVFGVGVYVDEAFQKAFVKVDEEGTEAAAVTAIILGRESAPPDPVRFVADRTFLFAIMHEETGAALFVGRVSEP